MQEGPAAKQSTMETFVHALR